jgi:uncharacterized protein YdaU (DUF1376 family)
MKAPAFQFYAADFLVGVMGMSDEEIGIYIKMLAFQWERGSLPNDRKMIKKLINSRKVPSEMVLNKFAISDDGFLKNQRLEKEREKQATFRESRANNAKKRWDKDKTDDALASTVHDGSISKTDALQSSSSSSELSLYPPGENVEKPHNFPTNPTAVQISKLYNRRPTTPWSPKEIKSFKAIGKIHPDDLELVCRYTEAERAKGNDGRHRRDLLTFLNNFPGELDRARAKPANGKSKATSAAQYGI